MAPVAVIGLGNDLRGDDGVGLLVVRCLHREATPPGVQVLEEHGLPLGLIERVGAYTAVVIVDAMRSGAPAGTVRRFDATRTALPGALRARVDPRGGARRGRRARSRSADCPAA